MSTLKGLDRFGLSGGGGLKVGDKITIERLEDLSGKNIASRSTSYTGKDYLDIAFKQVGYNGNPSAYMSCMDGYIARSQVLVDSKSIGSPTTALLGSTSGNRARELKVDKNTGRLFVICDDDTIREFRDDLTKVWEVNVGTDPYNLALDMPNDCLYIVVYNSTKGYMVLQKRSSVDGSFIWEADLLRGETAYDIKVKDGYIYIGRYAQSLRKYSPIDGSLIADSGTSGGCYFDFVDNSYIFLVGNGTTGSNYIYKVDMDLNVLWQSAQTTKVSTTQEVIADKTGVYVCASDLNYAVAKYSPDDGSYMWHTPTFGKKPKGMIMAEEDYYLYIAHESTDYQQIVLTKNFVEVIK
jgi:hypothetical protein